MADSLEDRVQWRALWKRVTGTIESGRRKDLCVIDIHPTLRSRRLPVRLLMAFCRKPDSADFPLDEVEYVQASALDTLRAVFPHIETYEEAGLGTMSIAKFERVIRDCGLRITSRRYDCIKRQDYLRYVPGVRELAINRVSCVLSE